MLAELLFGLFIFFFSASARQACHGVSQSLGVRIPKGKMLSNAKLLIWAKFVAAGLREGSGSRTAGRDAQRSTDGRSKGGVVLFRLFRPPHVFPEPLLLPWAP